MNIWSSWICVTLFKRTQDSLNLQNSLYDISFVIEARISKSQIIAITFVMESCQKEIEVYVLIITCPPNHYKWSSYYKYSKNKFHVSMIHLLSMFMCILFIISILRDHEVTKYINICVLESIKVLFLWCS